MFVNVMTKQQAKKAKKAAERYEVRAYAGFREDWRDWKKKKTTWTEWKIMKIVVWRRSRVRIRVRIRERSEKKSEEPVGDELDISLQPNGYGEGSGPVGDVIGNQELRKKLKFVGSLAFRLSEMKEMKCSDEPIKDVAGSSVAPTPTRRRHPLVQMCDQKDRTIEVLRERLANTKKDLDVARADNEYFYKYELWLKREHREAMFCMKTEFEFLRAAAAHRDAELKLVYAAVDDLMKVVEKFTPRLTVVKAFAHRPVDEKPKN